jgi:hypothetical protein
LWEIQLAKDKEPGGKFDQIWPSLTKLNHTFFDYLKNGKDEWLSQAGI